MCVCISIFGQANSIPLNLCHSHSSTDTLPGLPAQSSNWKKKNFLVFSVLDSARYSGRVDGWVSKQLLSIDLIHRSANKTKCHLCSSSISALVLWVRGWLLLPNNHILWKGLHDTQRCKFHIRAAETVHQTKTESFWCTAGTANIERQKLSCKMLHKIQVTPTAETFYTIRAPPQHSRRLFTASGLVLLRAANCRGPTDREELEVEQGLCATEWHQIRRQWHFISGHDVWGR